MRGAKAHLQLVQTVPRDVAGQVPPHDLEAERACLGSAMISADAREAVCEVASVEDFYDPANQRVREAIGDMARLSMPAEADELCRLLRDRGWLEKVGGADYLGRLGVASCAPANARAVAVRVAGGGALRRWLASAQASVAAGHSALEVAKFATVGDPTGAFGWIAAEHQRLALVAPGGPENLDAYQIGAAAAQESAAADAAAQNAMIAGPFVDTGIEGLDEKINIGPSEVLIVGATKGMGKTTLVRWIAGRTITHPRKLPDGRPECSACSCEAPCSEAHAFRKRGVLVFALEGKKQDWSDAIAARRAKLNVFDRAKGQWGPDDHARFLKELEQLKHAPLVIDDRKDLCKRNLGPRVRAWREWFARKGAQLELVILDYFQIAAWERGDSREQDLSEAGRHLITLATDPQSNLRGLAWVVIVALNKEGGARESGAIEYHADAFWRIAKAKGGDEHTRALRIHIEKQRRGPAGIGVPVWFDPAAGRFWT